MTEEAALSIRVLLVDDEPTQMEITKINLENADPSYHISLALTPKDALKLLQEKSFDVIVSDYQMPEMNGIQFFTTIRKTINIPFIIYTASGSEEVASAAFAAGVKDYVRKEATLVHYQVLEKRIRHAVENRRIETLYRISIDENCDGFAIIQGLDFVFANKAMANMLDLNSPEDLKGRSILTWIPIMERDLIRDRKLNRQRGGVEPVLYEYRVKKDNGVMRTLEARVTLIDYLGHPASLIFNHDVTERKRTERARYSYENTITTI